VRGTDRAAGLSLDPARLTLSGLSLALWMDGPSSAAEAALCRAGRSNSGMMGPVPERGPGTGKRKDIKNGYLAKLTTEMGM
jgi:hypothetical protein